MKIHRCILLAILLVAFGLRIHAITKPDLNIDEAWSFTQAAFFADREETSSARLIAIAIEPNNALHLLMSSPFVEGIPNALGIRWLSALASLTTVALAARAAYRLVGRRAALCTAAIVALAYWPVYYGQIGRPYALETAFATASLVFWLERRWTHNLLCSLGAAFSHVGALPVILVQDVFMLFQYKRRRSHEAFFWITNRLIVYAAVAGLTALVLKRGADFGRPISAGQPLPGLAEFIGQTVTALFGPLAGREPWYWLLIIGFGVSVAWALLRRVAHRAPAAPIGLPMLWILGSYAALVVMVFAANGPIKFVHLSHVAVALALLCGVAIASLPKRAGRALMVVYISLGGYSLSQHYTHPYSAYSQANNTIKELRHATEKFYSEHTTVLTALALNKPLQGSLAVWQEERAELAEPFWYINYDWGGEKLPTLPNACDLEPVRIVGQVRIHHCDGHMP